MFFDLGFLHEVQTSGRHSFANTRRKYLTAEESMLNLAPTLQTGREPVTASANPEFFIPQTTPGERVSRLRKTPEASTRVDWLHFRTG